MIFHPTDIDGVFIIEPERRGDERGFFARVFCREEFEANGLDPFVAQGNISSSAAAGTVRGMHYQLPPATESKYIRCLRGAVYDVIVDLRPGSSTFGQQVSVELSADNRLGIYVPPLFAHGHQALTDDVEITYLVNEFYTPGVERGIRPDDPALGIDWPLEITVLSDKDRSWDDFDADRIAAEIVDATRSTEEAATP